MVYQVFHALHEASSASGAVQQNHTQRSFWVSNLRWKIIATWCILSHFFNTVHLYGHVQEKMIARELICNCVLLFQLTANRAKMLAPAPSPKQITSRIL